MTPPDVTRTIAANAEAEIEVRKSRFLGAVVRVSSESDARAAIAAVRTRHWAANHHCSAWRIGSEGQLQRSSDDGEPAGSAGAPMLAVLAHADLTDIVAVVTRYFGGTKLGVGGLIRAYGRSVTMAIERAGVVERRPLTVTDIVIDHADAGRFEHALRSSEFLIAGVTYNPHSVTCTVHLDSREIERFERWVAEVSAGRARTRETGVITVEIPVTADTP